MKRELSQTDNKKADERECVDNSVSSQNEQAFPCAAALSPADGKAFEYLPDKNHSIKKSSKSMAESVTRHAAISNVDNIEYLTCGIDSLDVGFYVSWGENWNEQRETFDARKEQAYGTEGQLIDIPGIRPHIFYAGGKAPNYRYHIKFPEYDCFIAISQIASQSPNLYASITSEALHWELSEKELIELVTRDIESLGGIVKEHKISRCDLYADFRIPSGLSLDFIRSHKVGKAQKTNQHMNGDSLETYYAGEKKSPLQLRLYNKSVKIKEEGSEERWLLIWFTDDPDNVWRIEFQIRRSVLKEYRINTIHDLRNQKPDLWKYITGEWITLRYPDNENQSRRTIHPFWEKVQSCVKFFGKEQGSKRHYEKKQAQTTKWHVSRIKNMIISCAAITKDYELESCLMKIADEILMSTDKEEFKEKARMKSIDLGISINNEVNNDVSALFKKLYKK